MRRQYNFSKGERGKFYRPGARFNLPIHLDADVRRFVEGIAKSKRRDVSRVVNELLKSGMRLAQVIK